MSSIKFFGETVRRLGDRFREHLRDVERNDKDASKPVARHFHLPNHSKQHMAVCGLSLPSGILLNRSDSPASVVRESDSPTSSRSAEGLAQKEKKTKTMGKMAARIAKGSSNDYQTMIRLGEEWSM